jgi:hypothetical protein
VIFKGCGVAPFMKNKLQRYYGRKELHFITFSCYQRRPLLNGVRAKTVFVKILEEVRTRYQFSLVGYVLMPEHVHLLIGEPVRVTPFEGCAGFEATSIASDAAAKKTKFNITTQASICSGAKWADAILATTVL